MKYCSYCHSPLDDRAKFCSVCDREVELPGRDFGKSPAKSRVLLASEMEEDIRRKIYGSDSEEASLPVPAEEAGDEIATPSLHSYGAKLFQELKDTCVVIRTKTGSGTGFFLENGLVATNAHVVMMTPDQPAEAIEIHHMGIPYVGKVLCASVSEDVAIVYLPFGKPANVDQYANTIGDSHALLPGDQVFTIGNARGLGLTYAQFTVKDVTKHQGKVAPFRETILLNGSCQPGNSGGPLYNVEGAVVGICSFSPMAPQPVSIFVNTKNKKSVWNTQMNIVEPGVAGGVTIETLMSLLKGDRNDQV